MNIVALMNKSTFVDFIFQHCIQFKIQGDGRRDEMGKLKLFHLTMFLINGQQEEYLRKEYPIKSFLSLVARFPLTVYFSS